jgi:predicted O-methyltransferase YrrM
MVIKILNRLAGNFGYALKKKESNIPVDIFSDKDFMLLYDQCKDYTMTTIERMYSLYQSMNYILKNNIEGNFVECGVWKGGSSMLIALMLQKQQMNNRKLYLYDTFEGMSEPSEFDKTFSGQSAEVLLTKEKKEIQSSVWCYSSLDEVKLNLYSTGFAKENIIFIKGKVEDTIKDNLPGNLSLLRLDTDWYESTKIELELLYPLLQNNGVLIIDDFGHWDGAKRAVVEYFEKIKLNPFLFRIDFTGRLMIKPGDKN